MSRLIEWRAFAARLSLWQETGRKLIHLAGIILPVWYVAWGPEVMRPLMLGGTALLVLTDLVRLRWPFAGRVYRAVFGPLSRGHEEYRLTGASLFMIGQTLAVFLLPASVAPAAMTFGIVGDTAAALVGKYIGGPAWREGKTFVGSAACLLASFLGGIVWGTPWPAALAGAAAATLVEGFSKRVDDNLTIPLVGGLAMWAMLGAMG